MKFMDKSVSRMVGNVAAIASLMLLLCNSVAAQDKDINRPPVLSGEGGAIPVRVIDDRLVVSCDISGTKLRIPVNLWLDFDGPYGLQLHNKAAANLPAKIVSDCPQRLLHL